jgi:phospholipase C
MGAEAGPARGSTTIDHVVVLMLENRSFDQMLGLLPGVDGVTIGAHASSVFVNYLDPQHPRDEDAFPAAAAEYFGIPEGDVPPPQQLSGVATELYGGPSHSFPSATQQLCNDAWGLTARGARDTTPATNSGFVRSYAEELSRTYQDWAKSDAAFVAPAQPPRDHVAVAMAVFSPEQLPVLSGLAQAFCVCDQWYSEVPGPTEPNRLFMHAATSMGLVHNPWEFPITARTIYEDIDERGTKTWATYFTDLADAANFPALKVQTDKLRDWSRFTTDLHDPDTFPNYVFLCPQYMNSADGFANCQHAPWDVRYGEHWIADVYEALRASPLWERTLLVITYDEHGGFYDHVTPPSDGIARPDEFTSPTAYDKQKYPYTFRSDGSPNPEYVFGFDRLGFRVPAVLVSPWLAAGHVESRRLQHTSVLATVRKMWGLRPEPLTAREAQAATFDDLFEGLDAPRTDCPTTLVRPPLPDVSLSAAADQPLSPSQRDVFTQVTHLDGHEHSGQEAPMPATQGETAAYIAERNAAHRAHHAAKASTR